MKVFVTGGAGYIGSVAVEQLILAGHEVMVFDNLSLGHRAAVHPEAELVVGDLAEVESIRDAMGRFRPEAIMHFAAKSLVGESMQDPFLYLGDNVSNALNLLKCVVEFEVPRFILSSTANLFDDPERVPISEDERIVPGSPYGESKYIIERYLHWMSRVYPFFNYAALRYFNAAGASELRGEDHTPELHLIPLVLQVALGQREKIYMFGDDYDTADGTCIRDYIHVIDLAQAHILALGAIENGDKVYNLGNGQGYSVKQVIETAREVTGHAIPAEVQPRRAGDPATLIAASGKIVSELGWKPKYPDLKSIIASAWAWHVAHPNGYQD
ncbi:UDP-glucose 4-epimerase GalE [Coraliomargarita sp. SDUM461004]|uniref:UDP-glucose 4-epimerase n=1 Tax=Thalassobacterium sedimentorum TaxID=3041258 RepID=A0ABU1AQD2_9BACT|nr:UDP-glucose 4-epimerase GalE [Coraliomargarita sp. SDUM461004]MDQ8195803.1 UDP-glucose 4-epimerase GalE [Coraliomargarita sp. SDUM461004]